MINFTFSQGEIDPKMQSRAEWAGYYTSAKQVRNAQVLPQGGVQCRWGLTYVDTAVNTNTSLPFQSEISTLLYDNDLVYLMLWENLSLKIYLENILIATIATTYTGADIPNLRFTQVQDRLIVTNPNFAPAQLQRNASTPTAITTFSMSMNSFTVASALQMGLIYPVVFTTTGTLPTTSPQIFTQRTYFIYALTSNLVQVYATSSDAYNMINAFSISALGSGTTSIVPQNTWTLSNISFTNVPAYDFNGGYSALTFTPSATSGTITLTASGAIFTVAMVGGYFSGNGGVIRLNGYTSSTVMSGFVNEDFLATTAIPGSLCFLGEPAWSVTRGYPSLASFFQNRLVFANSPSLVNGTWLSTVNEVYNFDDSEALADSAISWYPGGGSVNYIVALTSARSLIVHTNTGAYSTPLLSEAPVTPANFVLIEQNKFSCDTIQPVFIDNQIIFVDTASNVINMIWDIAVSAYITNNISVMSSSLITSPVDMTYFYEPKATDGFYALFVNSDGTLAVYQTLHEQNIGAWSLMNTSSQIVADQQDGYTTTPSSFIHVISGNNRCWVLIERQMPVANSAVAITGNTSSTLIANAHGMPVDTPVLITFTTSVSLPSTSPQINTTQYWFANATSANAFSVYQDMSDATAQTNALVISSSGVNSQVVYWPLTPKLYLEEVNFNLQVDAGTNLTLSAPNANVTGLSWLNGNVVNVVADTYLLGNQTVFNGQITNSYAGTNYQIGLNFVTTLQFLPISIPQVMGILYNPVHIRNIYVRYYQTVGAQIQAYNIPVITMQEVVIGEPALPQDGVYSYTPMEGWDNQTANIIITQSNPLPMTILGVSYILEII